MCLNVLQKLHSPPLTKIKKGWKIFVENSNGAIYFPFFNTEKAVRRNRWLIDAGEDYFLWARDIDWNKHDQALRYPCGFHIFVNRKNAADWAKRFVIKMKIKEVFYQNIVAEGEQNSFPVVIAKRLFVPLNKKKRKNVPPKDFNWITYGWWPPLEPFKKDKKRKENVTK